MLGTACERQGPILSFHCLKPSLKLSNAVVDPRETPTCNISHLKQTKIKHSHYMSCYTHFRKHRRFGNIAVIGFSNDVTHSCHLAHVPVKIFCCWKSLFCFENYFRSLSVWQKIICFCLSQMVACCNHVAKP